ARAETRSCSRARSSAPRSCAAARPSPRPHQVLEPKNPGGVAVREMDPDAVIADEVHVRHRDVLGHGLRIEDALAGRLRLAVRARATDAQLAGGPDVLDTLVPDEPDLALAESDDLERHGHTRRIAPICGIRAAPCP